MENKKAVRNTKQRKLLLELLGSTKSHPNALWLYGRMKERFPNLSLSTVYRNLGILEQQGLLLRLPCVSFDRYDADTSVHSHFSCRSCERVYDLEEAGGVLKHNPATNHRIEGCNIIYYGVCEECLSKNEEGLQ